MGIAGGGSRTRVAVVDKDRCLRGFAEAGRPRGTTDASLFALESVIASL